MFSIKKILKDENLLYFILAYIIVKLIIDKILLFLFSDKITTKLSHEILNKYKLCFVVTRTFLELPELL